MLFKKNIYNIKNLSNSFFNFLASLTSKPYRHLFFISDSANWVLDWEIREIKTIAESLGISPHISTPSCLFRQSIYYHSKYILKNPKRFLKQNNRIAFPYYHGYPSSGDPTHILCYDNLKKFHHKIDRIQVSHTYMRDIILETGIDSRKVFLIPIGINTAFFQIQTPELKNEMREKYGLPQNAVVIGSFQKDGEGWGKGSNPKMIKGPDVFLKTVGLLKQAVPELFVLLSGPARGYVKKGLEEFEIPYKHIYLKNYPEIGELYQCLDVYIIASREEGGPKAILESMASGVPLVTTRVGQAMDLVVHGENALMFKPEEAAGLAAGAESILSDTETREQIVKKGFQTVEQNSYQSQIPLWKKFFKGFVDS